MTQTNELKLLINAIRNSEDFDMIKLDQCFPDDESLVSFCIRFTASNVYDAFETFLLNDKKEYVC